MASTLNLEGRVALVTGSVRGIGWATARALATAGAHVIINGVSNEAAMNACVDELRNTCTLRAQGLLFDVGDPAAVKRAYTTIFQEHKRLDILVNNAGILHDDLLGMIQPDVLDKILQTNVKGLIYNMQYASRLMARGGWGAIVNVSSIIGRVGNEGQVAYAASKAAVIGATLSAAKELAPQNIRVNAVAPGVIDTDMVRQVPPDKLASRLHGVRMKRIGNPAEVAAAILFLASDMASYVTGQVLGVDGGMVV